ncbi:MAG: NADH-quinone oxidoreductase subunit J [Gammaproteobacteria bacterium]|nr:NADH-quinone oxidoreductase subunit J [Gammaproteobacteria bacterium]NIR81592.1 NADH-quinone oxidoreductase subunit J [Gammaproteobacteria bacterium]NIU02705.1 NADH-quinone oxidoreductase subunit J [Gammaproteobacteria bacterium]NIV50282.1 NADH-quinone oxidoreductase subunit J [Gammaproteobacteria bacterium]NIW85012.1 NADH-quinone oxidoreductase subunit J [Gammaproteobacteria bacterium]
MTFEQLLFYIFGAVLVFAGFRVITVRNPVHAALFLVLGFFTSAALWLLMEAEFLAIVLVLVYVGAVMVLFLFVVMMLDINVAQLRSGFVQNLPLGATVAFLIIAEMALVAGSKYWTDSGRYGPPVRHGTDYSNTEALGNILYTDYVYPFEIAAAVLLVAIIAAIALTIRRRPGTKHQDPAEQVRVRRRERVRLVRMGAEKRE